MRLRSALEQMVRHQRRTMSALAGRLDQVQRDAEMALEALTVAESRIADLEARVEPYYLAAVRAGQYVPPRKTWLVGIADGTTADPGPA